MAFPRSSISVRQRARFAKVCPSSPTHLGSCFVAVLPQSGSGGDAGNDRHLLARAQHGFVQFGPTGVLAVLPRCVVSAA